MFNSYLKSTRGNIAVVTAVSILAVTMCIGAAVDMSRLISAKSNAQDSLDSAVLAAGIHVTKIKPNLSNSTEEAKIKQLIIDNLAAKNSDRNFGVSLSANDITISEDSINAVAKGDGHPVLAHMFGYDSLKFDVEAAVKYGVGEESKQNIEADIVVILDITGSMAWLLDPLKTNLVNFANDLSDELESHNIEPDQVRLKVILYRDWFNPHQSIWRNIYYGPDTLTVLEWGPMYGSPFYSLPQEKAKVSTYLSNFNASRGKDVPESAIEPISYALHADDWNPDAKKVILLWTDAPAKDTFENIHQLVGHYYYNDSNELFNWPMDEFYQYEDAFAAFHQSNLDKMDAADHADAISLSINMYSNIVPTTDLGAFDLVIDWPGVEFNDNRTPNDEDLDVSGFDMNYVAPGPDVAYADVLERTTEALVSLTSDVPETVVYLAK